MERLSICAAVLLFSTNFIEAGTEGFCKTVISSQVGYTDIVTVSAGKELVIRQIHAFDEEMGGSIVWEIDVNDSVLIPGTIIYSSLKLMSSEGTVIKFSHDFPDGCVVVSENQTLRLKLIYRYYSLPFTLFIVGYYRDAITQITCDFNNDHIVNFADFAVFANNWLKQG